MQTNSNRFYIHSLYLKNFATFESERISFTTGFNAIIGETGSGKSLLLDALTILLGGRGDKKFIRKDSEYAIIEAEFIARDPEIKKVLAELGHPIEDDHVVIKRILYPAGATKNYLNNLSCPLATLSHFARLFVDLVGQFENQKLLSEEYQLNLLDHYAHLESKVEEYQKEFKIYQDNKSQLDKVEKAILDFASREDFLQFQVQEIEKLAPSINEEENLIAQKERLQNKSRFIEANSKLLHLLEGDDHSLTVLTKKVRATYLEYDDLFSSSINEEVDALCDKVASLSFMISKESSRIEEEELSLDEVLGQLDRYQKLKRKFGNSVEQILAEYEAMKKEISYGVSLKDEKIKIESRLTELLQSLKKRALILHDERKKSALSLADNLGVEIRQLNMKDATIEFRLKEKEILSQTGITALELLAETNKGEGLYLLKDIASGGELSRILLALRKLIAKGDTVSIFLFDEIDTGIGGKTAVSIGKAIKEVSLSTQVLAITHLPQIAHKADTLLIVSKGELKADGHVRTKSEIVMLTEANAKNKFVEEMGAIGE